MPLFAQNLIDEKNAEIDDLSRQLQEVNSGSLQKEVDKLVRKRLQILLLLARLNKMSCCLI